MNRIRTLLAATAVVPGLLLMVPTARASTVTETYDFTLSNFVNGAGTDPSPLGSITGEVTVTFDPTVPVLNGALTLDSLSGPFAPPVTFTTLQYTLNNEIWIGNDPNYSYYIHQGFNEFTVGLFTNNPGAPQLITCANASGCGSAPMTAFAAGYALSADPSDYWIATAASVEPVPAPSPWLMLVSGLGAIGLVCRKGRAGPALL